MTDRTDHNSGTREAGAARGPRPSWADLLGASVDHGYDVVRLRTMRWSAAVRARLLRFVAAVLIFAVVTAVAMATAAWGVVHLLTKLSIALGSTWIAVLAAIGLVGLVMAVSALILRSKMRRSYLRRCRQKLRGESKIRADAPPPEVASLSAMERGARGALQEDVQHLHERSTRILKQHPWMSLAAAGVSGFAATGARGKAPSSVRARRSTILWSIRAALRLLRVQGVAALVQLLNKERD